MQIAELLPTPNLSKTNDNGCDLNVIDAYFILFQRVPLHVTLVAFFHLVYCIRLWFWSYGTNDWDQCILYLMYVLTYGQ